MTEKQRELVEENKGLAYKIAGKMFNTRLPFDFDDVVQIAFLWMCRAAVAYKEEVGAKFSTYSWVAMDRGIKRAIKQHYYHNARVTCYLDDFANDNEGLKKIDIMTDGIDYAEIAEIHTALEKAMEKESSRNKDIFAKSINGMFDREIGEGMNITFQRVDQIKKRIRKKFTEEYEDNEVSNAKDNSD